MNSEFRHCNACGAWEIDYATANKGECRRHSPTIADDNFFGVWPITSPFEGCYEAVPQRPLSDVF